MKPFNIEQAKQGAKVCTRDGADVRILSFDIANRDYPIQAIVQENDCERIYFYTPHGKLYKGSTPYSGYDLMMDIVEDENSDQIKSKLASDYVSKSKYIQLSMLESEKRAFEAGWNAAVKQFNMK